jgi:hypothetical protein
VLLTHPHLPQPFRSGQTLEATLSPRSQPLVRLSPELLVRLGYRTASILHAVVDGIPELKSFRQIA